MNRLREVRQARGLTQAELGRRLRVDPSMVRHVEAGRIQPYPRFRRLAAKVLRVNEEELFGQIG
jgi:transcriptional regulator with XRE-family HTH domain